MSFLALAVFAVAAPADALVVTVTKGFRHSSIPTAEKVIEELAESSGEYDVTLVQTEEQYRAWFTPEGLANVDVVIFANTTGDLGASERVALLDRIEDGMAFVGAHSAADTYRTEQTGGDSSFPDMLGGEFEWHGAQCEVTCRVNTHDHPSTEHFDEFYVVFDEIYHFRENDTKPVRSRANILLSVDTHPMDGGERQGQPGDYPISWARKHGEGKVFYTALGHREDVWESEPFKKHLLGGIRWALAD